MIEIIDKNIKSIEREIIRIYTTDCHDYTEFGCLLSLRKEMINDKVLEHQDELLPDIIAFNEALTNALREMYDRAYLIWRDVKNRDAYGDNVILEAKCFLDYKYPKLHPVQGDDRSVLWSAICDPGWNGVYDDGVTLDSLRLTKGCDQMSFEKLIGMDCPQGTNNWNDGLDPDLTKDLHLISAFHNLFEHTRFAITDFIYVRKFETEITLEFDKRG